MERYYFKEGVGITCYNHRMLHRVGIYPGTFDPMHIGHLSFALKALSVSKLDKIIILPEKYPRGKEHVTDLPTRVSQMESLTKNYSQLKVFTLKTMPITLRSEKQELAHIFETNDVVLLLGSDILPNLVQWQDIAQLLHDHELCIGMRGNDTHQSVRDDILKLEKQFSLDIPYSTVTTKHKNISSTKIRAQSE